MRVLITGSSGRIGSAVAKWISKTHEVVGLDVVAGPYTKWIGRITDEKLVGKLTAAVDAVIHTAALHAPHVGIEPDAAFFHTNVRGTECLVAAALENGVGKLVYTSSTSVYGTAMVVPDRAAWVSEELQPVPRDIYDETKLAAEQICSSAAKAGLPCVSLRISRCFPEPDNLTAIYRLYRGADARDIAHAHALALESEIDGFEIFNISAESAFARGECAELFNAVDQVILRHYPWTATEFERRGWVLPNCIDRVYAIDKAQRMLGYRPRYNFETLFDRGGQSPS